MARVLHALVLVAAVTVGYVLLKAVPRGVEDAAIKPLPLELDEEASSGAVGRFATALTFRTLADPAAPNHIKNAAPFQQLHEHLKRSFPLVYKKLKHERVNDHSILFTWQGSNPELRPLLALSHIDVVPAPEGQGFNWTHPPFGGAVADGFIWGRGALDVKVTALQQLEAVALLLRQGYTPARTLLLALGHDEEVGGEAGAKAIAALLASRGVQLEVVLDEGGLVLMDGIGSPSFQLVAQPVALVGTAEKGYQTWEVHATGEGGHSSMPPVDGSSVASRISRIIAALDAYPTTTRLGPPTSDWLVGLAPGVKWAPVRALMASANNWIINPILGQLLGQAGKEISPLVRTTCGVVGINAGGIADNVLPRTGSIKLNCRILPGHDTAFLSEYLEMVTRREKPHVKLTRADEGVPPPPVAPSSGPHWQLVKQAILETLQPEGGLLVAPFLLSGMTDSRYYLPLAEGRVYRFGPQRYTRGDLGRVHGVDERVAVDDFLRGIGYYRRVFMLATGDESSREAMPS